MNDRAAQAGGMTTDAGMTKPRWWQDLRWIAAGLVALLMVTLAWGLFGPEPPIRVARETTYLTARLAADGLPDYEAALLASYGPAPPPDENAVVLFLQTCWPLGIDGAHLPAVCRALGIPDVPPPESLMLDPRDDAAAGVTREMIDAAHDWPWTAEHLPAVAAWLTKRESLIDRLVAAADRPHYWLPSPSLLDGKPEPLWGIRPPEQELFGVAYVLRLRAMWHVGENRPAAAWRDIRAIRRLARLVTPPGRRPQFAWMQFRAMGVHANAADATRQMLAMPDLPAEVLATIRQDLEGPGPTVALSDSIASKRLRAIDAAVWLARRTPGGRRVRMKLAGDGEFLRGSGDLALLTSLDWNLILERLNTHCDELEAVCGLRTHQARAAAVAKIEGRRAWAPRSTAAWASEVLLQLCGRGHRSDRFADRVDLSGVWPTILWAATRSDAQFSLTKTAAALAAWHADREAATPPYPERLDDLVPKYLAAVPVDPFTDNPFIYERRGDGYLLASVGDNGVYDGGDDLSGWIVRGEWQGQRHSVNYGALDLVVRMPIPKRPAAVAPRP